MKIGKLTLDILSELIIIVYLKTVSLFSKYPDRWNLGEKTLLIITGFGGNWMYMKTIANYFNSNGYKIIVAGNLRSGTLTLTESVAIVKKIIQNIDDELIIVSHSKGGLISKLLLIDSECAPKIRKCINIASPYDGSIWGYLNILSLNELRPDSKILKRLKLNKKVNSKIINIYPNFDELVLPHRSLYLKEAKNYCVDVNGHVKVLKSKETLSIIAKHVSKGLV